MRSFVLGLVVLAVVFLSIGCGKVSELFSGGAIDDSMEPRAALTLSTAKLKKRSTYSLVAKSKTVAGEVTTELGFVAPDKFSVKTTMPAALTEAIVVGDDVFTRVNGGKWTKDAGESGISREGLMPGFDFENREDVIDVEFSGREVIDQKEVLVYKFKSLKPYRINQTVWVDPQTSLPVKGLSDGEFSGAKIETSTSYDYQREISIVRPQVFD